MTSASTDKKTFKKGENVSWKWGSSWAYGKVHEIFHDKVTKTIKGKSISRNASEEKPAYLLVQENGQEVLKSITELHPIEKRHEPDRR